MADRRALLTEYARHLREVAGPLQRTVAALDELRQFQRRAEAAGLALPLPVPEIAELRSFGRQAAECIGDISMGLEGTPDPRAVRRAIKAEKFSR